MNLSPVAPPQRLTIALGSTLCAIKLVFVDYKDLKSVLSKLSLTTLNVSLLQQLHFHQAPNLTATALRQRCCSEPQKNLVLFSTKVRFVPELLCLCSSVLQL